MSSVLHIYDKRALLLVEIPIGLGVPRAHAVAGGKAATASLFDEEGSLLRAFDVGGKALRLSQQQIETGQEIRLNILIEGEK